ncbi:beta strand repeat-containing protein [Tenacibaculum agarivorans]|uniref:beta strand repeat-containing protein n=1 Tax=Tenacibaculum agarivorans TaxID=1908389 RepID=UPI00094B8584|nr:T9SS type A sorting domain-containing protein [Tenacibaculum agarivorans]
MKKTILFIIFTIILNIPQVFSQLAAGDIAIIGYNTDSPDGFSFITLTDIPASEVIFFTEQGWSDITNTWVGNTEPHFQYTAPAGGLSCGTIVSIIETTTDSFAITGGGSISLVTLAGTGFNLSGGDQILIYQAATAKPASAADITFITALNGDISLDTDGWNSNLTSTSTTRSSLPPGLTNGTNAVGLFPPGTTERNNAKYTGTLTGNSSALSISINNRNNWSVNDGTNLGITPSDYSGVSVTCSAPCDASFSYASSSYCVNGSDPSPTITGTTGGTFSSTSGLSIASNGTIDLSASTPNTYTVTYTASVGCSEDVSITITAADDASFSYSSSSYCKDASDPSPTITGLTGGSFSSTSGLSIATNGTIDVSASTAGTYTVTYTTAGTCPNSSTASITINNLDNASFAYGASSYCVDASDPSPTISGLTGGSFSSTSGLSIATNGTIDVSASTPGTYTVTYTTAGTCPNSSTASVTINALDDASFSYGSSSYCKDASDPSPTITGLTGGSFSSTSGLSIATNGTIDVSASTAGTYTVTYTTAGTCPNSSTASITINNLDNASFAYGASSYCVDASDPSPTISGLTGGSFSSTSGLSIATNGTIDVSASTPGTYTVTYTTAGTCPNSSTASVTINALDDASFSYGSSSYTIDDADPSPTISGLTGGSFSSTPGLSIASNGIIDLSASTPNTYTVTYTTAGTCPNSSTFDVTVTFSTYTWTGAINNSWEQPGNWNTNVAPHSTGDVIIPSGLTSYPTISSAVTVGTISIASGASLIANASVTGTTTYTRNLPTTNWYLVSAPVSGETQEDIINNPSHNFATGSGSNIGIGAFTNNGTDPWVYATSATTGPLVSGAGVSMKLAATGDVSITGSVNTTNINFPIATGTRNNFNLIGNPFTSFVNSSTFATANTGLLSEETVWLWDGSQYITYNNMSSIEIAPAQGFFVEASGSGNVTFSTANQSHQSSDTFLRETPKSYFELFAESNGNKKATKVFYLEGKTKGFDNGYDSKIFGGTNDNFTVYTQLLNDNDGRNLAIQTLPNVDHNTMVIPVGLIAESGNQITFSAISENLPDGLHIYLEDRIESTFTNLTDTNYSISLTDATNGIGRFYIHTSAKSLSSEDIKNNVSEVSIYKSASKEITIAGLQTEANVKIYSTLGKSLVNTQINSNGISTIELPSFAAGIYLVKLTSDRGIVTKKVIIE